MSAREGDGEARYEIVLEEARVIQQMFAWVGRDGLSIRPGVSPLEGKGQRFATGKKSLGSTTVWSQLENQRSWKVIFGKR